MATTLIHNGTLIDGNGGDPVSGAAVLIEENVIKAVGPAAGIPVPEGTTRIDAGGGTIMPGFIDTHVHIMFEYNNPYILAQIPFSMRFYNSIHYMRRTLDAGITAIRDAGGADLGIKQAVEQGKAVGPRIKISTAPLGITGGHGDGWLPSGVEMNLFPPYPGMPDGRVDGVPAVRQRTREVLRAGADFIKIMATGGVLSPTDHPEFVGFSMDELKAIVEEGENRLGVKVMAHAQGLKGIKMAVEAGIFSIEHGIYLDDAVCERMVEKGTFVVPTLLAPVAVLEIAEATGALPEYAVNKARETIEAHAESIGLAHKKGVKIAMGTDAGVMPHGTNLRELTLMARVGMSPMDVIVSTTKVAAECMQMEDQIGTVEVGKLADIIISKTDPLADLPSLENVDNIVLVMKDGDVVKDIRT